MKKQYLIIIAVLAIFLAVYFKFIPLEIAHTGMLVCPGKPVTLDEWTFPSLWTTKPPECVANPNGNAIIYPIVEITDTSTGAIIYTKAFGTTSVPCAYGVKVGSFTFTVPSTAYGEFNVAGRYANTYGTNFYSYTDSFSASSSGCSVCSSGQHKCNGNYLLTCTADGVYNLGGQLCQFGCTDSGNGVASCVAKTPNFKHCIDSKTYEQYSADGTYVEKTVGCDLLSTCVEGQGCVAGGGGCFGDADCPSCFTHCVSNKCTVTGTQPQKPCTNAYWEGYSTCAWNTKDCSNYTEFCGNGFCGATENYSSCPVDCAPPATPMADWMYVVIIGGVLLVIFGIIKWKK